MSAPGISAHFRQKAQFSAGETHFAALQSAFAHFVSGMEES
jgi:hypothetical protein